LRKEISSSSDRSPARQTSSRRKGDGKPAGFPERILLRVDRVFAVRRAVSRFGGEPEAMKDQAAFAS